MAVGSSVCRFVGLSNYRFVGRSVLSAAGLSITIALGVQIRPLYQMHCAKGTRDVSPHSSFPGADDRRDDEPLWGKRREDEEKRWRRDIGSVCRFAGRCVACLRIGSGPDRVEPVAGARWRDAVCRVDRAGGLAVFLPGAHHDPSTRWRLSLRRVRSRRDGARYSAARRSGRCRIRLWRVDGAVHDRRVGLPATDRGSRRP